MLKRFLFTFCIAATIVIVFSAFVTQKRDGRRALEAMEKQLAEEVADLREKNSNLKNEFDALKNDPLQIEKEAREKHGYIKPGERTYVKHNFAIKSPKKGEIEKPSFLARLDSFLFDGPFPWQVPLGIIAIAAIFLTFSYRHEYKGLHRQGRE